MTRFIGALFGAILAAVAGGAHAQTLLGGGGGGGGGSGCTPSGSAGNVLTDSGSGACNSDANATLSNGALSLGSSGTAGSLTMGNATSGTITVQPVTGALGTITEFLPISSGDTLVGLAATQTLTNKTLTSPTINGGALSGTIAGTPTLSGNLTFSGVPLMTGLSGGTRSSCLGLDSGNDIVTGACGGSVTFDQIGSGTNTTAAMMVGSGATLGFTGTGAMTNATIYAGSGGVTYSGGGVITQLGSITGGSLYTVGSAILSLTSITGGSGYVTGVYTGVPLTGGSGASATATITVNVAGAVNAVTITAGANGTGYLSTDTGLSASNANLGGSGSGFLVNVGSVGYYNVSLTGGTGSGAKANITVNAGGAVSAVALTSHGTLYTANDALSALAANIGGTGSGFSVPASTVGTAGSPANAFIWASNPSASDNPGSNSASGICGDLNVCTSNLFVVNTDNVNAKSAANGYFGYIFNDVTGSSALSSHGTALFEFTYNATTSDATEANYVGVVIEAAATAPAPAGGADFFGLNVQCKDNTTGFHQCVAAEFDVDAFVGATLDELIGLQVVQQIVGGPAGGEFNAAFTANGKNGAVGWDHLLTDGAYDGYPAINTTGEVFGCFPHANTGSCGTIGNGIDFSNYTAVSGDLIKGVGGTNYIDGAFNVKANTLAGLSSTCAPSGTYIYTPAVNTIGFCANGNAVARVTAGSQLFLGSGITAQNASDTLSAGVGSGSVALASITIGNASSNAAAGSVYYLKNNTSATEGSLSVNSSSNTTSFCATANCVELSGAAGVWIAYGTTTGMQVSSGGGINLPNIANAAGNEILCFDTTGGPVTYENAVAGCVPSGAQFKNIQGRIDPAYAAQAIASSDPSVYTYKDTDKFGTHPYDGLIAQEMCAIDEVLCIRDGGVIVNYDHVGALAYAFAAIKWQQREIEQLRRR